MNNFFAELKRRNVVRVAIAYVVVSWVILQFVDIIKEILTFPDWFSQMVLVLLIIGLPIALILSWAYEVTPEGVKKTAEVDQSKSITHGTGRRINKLIIGGLVLAVGFLLYDKFFINPDSPVIEEAQAGRVTIAVLPFADLSPEGDQEYFGDGMAEEILNFLAKSDGLKVTSRSSSFSFKGQNLDIPTMAERLGVDNILEGSIRKDGNRVRITAQLIDVRSDTHLWSETFDRDISDVFQVQDEIARAIGEALEIQFGVGQGPVVVAQTTSPEAHEEYLKGRFFWNKRSIGQIYEAERHFRRAIELDPQYAMAHLGLAETLILVSNYEPAKRDFRPEYEGAELSARRALELDPTLGQAHTTLGTVLTERGRLIEAKAEYQKGIEMAPDYGTAWQWYGNFESIVGRQNAGEALMLKAREIDPLSPIILSNTIDNLIISNKFSRAREELENALALFPDFAFFHYSEATIRLYEKDYEGAREAFRKYGPLDNVDPGTYIAWIDLIEIYETTGERGPLSDELSESIANKNIYVSPYDLIFAAGYQDEAVEIFYSGRSEFGFDTAYLYYLWQPRMRPFVNLREVKDILIEIGMLEFWKADGWPDMCRPVGEEDFICE